MQLIKLYFMRDSTKNFLSIEERSALYTLQRSLHNKKQCDRVRVILLLDQGWDYGKIATALFLDETTIRRYLKIYLKDGTKALLDVHYKGRASELTADQLNELSTYVEESCPSNGCFSR